MIRHKYIEHIQEVENIRRDESMPPSILAKVDELQILLTSELMKIMEGRNDDV